MTIEPGFSNPPPLHESVLEAIQEGIAESAKTLSDPDVCVVAKSSSGFYAYRYASGEFLLYHAGDILDSDGKISPDLVRESRPLGKWNITELRSDDAVGIGLALRFWLGETARACGIGEPIWE